MEKDRLLAMTDGVAAVIITIMVLELKAPEGSDWGSLHELWPVFFGYVLSFIYVAIYWNNHHHYFHLVERVNGAVLWANFHLLFWLSLIPFSTAWLGEHGFMPVPPPPRWGGGWIGGVLWPTSFWLFGLPFFPFSPGGRGELAFRRGPPQPRGGERNQ